MTNTTVKAIVASVKIGHLTIDGLMMPNGDFAIAIPQIAEMFLDNQSQASQTLKRLMGKDFKTNKVKTEFNRNATLSVPLPEFERVVAKLDRAGNIKAQDFRDELAGLGLHQIFCDAFGLKFEEIDRQNWLKERQEGKFYRRSLTDAIKHLIAPGSDVNYGYITLQTYKACGLDSDYKSYKANHKDHNYRNTLDDVELRKIAKFEELTADYVLVDKLNIESAMKSAARYIR